MVLVHLAEKTLDDNSYVFTSNSIKNELEASSRKSIQHMLRILWVYNDIKKVGATKEGINWTMTRKGLEYVERLLTRKRNKQKFGMNLSKVFIA
jgi:hypothetical protein